MSPLDVPVVVREGEERAAAPGDGARQPHHAAPQQTLAVPQRHLQLRHRVRRAGECGRSLFTLLYCIYIIVLYFDSPNMILALLWLYIVQLFVYVQCTNYTSETAGTLVGAACLSSLCHAAWLSADTCHTCQTCHTAQLHVSQATTLVNLCSASLLSLVTRARILGRCHTCHTLLRPIARVTRVQAGVCWCPGPG